MKETAEKNGRKGIKISLATVIDFIGLCAIIVGLAAVWCIYM